MAEWGEHDLFEGKSDYQVTEGSEGGFDFELLGVHLNLREIIRGLGYVNPIQAAQKVWELVELLNRVRTAQLEGNEAEFNAVGREILDKFPSQILGTLIGGGAVVGAAGAVGGGAALGIPASMTGHISRYRAGTMSLYSLMNAAGLLGFGAMEVYQMLGYTSQQSAELAARMSGELEDWRQKGFATYQDYVAWQNEQDLAQRAARHEQELGWQVPEVADRYADIGKDIGTREKISDYLGGLGYEADEIPAMVESVIAGELALSEIGPDWYDDPAQVDESYSIGDFIESMYLSDIDTGEGLNVAEVPEFNLDDMSGVQGSPSSQEDRGDYSSQLGEGSVPDSFGEAGVNSFPEGRQGQSMEVDSMSYGRGGMYKGRDGKWHWPSGAVVNQGRRSYGRSYRRY